MSPRNKQRIAKRVGVSTVVAIGALATGISVAGAASNTGSAATKAPTTIAGGAHAWHRGPFGDLGVVGSVTKVSSNSITVKDPGGALTTYTLSGSTVVRKDGADASVASLAVGENVAVMVAATGSTSAVTIVIVPAGMSPGEDPGGVVTAVSPTSITLEHLDGTSSTYVLNSATTVREGRASATVSAIAVGERVQVRPSASSVSTAAAVEIDLAKIRGTVVSESGNTIVVSDAQGFYRTIQLTNTTTYSKSGAVATMRDVVTGAVIVAEGTVGADHTTLDASVVDIGVGPFDGGPAGFADPGPGSIDGGPAGGPGAGPMGHGLDAAAH